MNNNPKKYNFLDYINNPISKEGVTLLYSANNIRFEKCELYSDFVQSLLRLCFDTYLGDDVTNIEQQIKHFKWCWDKNINNFTKEGLIFDNQVLYHYFLEFMLEVFYSSVDKEKFNKVEKSVLKLWYNIFDYTKTKSYSDMDALIEIYGIFEKSLKTI